MKQTLNVKNMVCNRCKLTIAGELDSLGYSINSHELGKVVLHDGKPIAYSKLKEFLKKQGVEIKMDETEVMIEEVKIVLINIIENQDSTQRYSFLMKTFNKTYSALSNLFNKTEGLTMKSTKSN